MDNHEIVRIARNCLKNHSYGQLRDVECRMEGNELFLVGTLPSFYLKQLAFHAIEGKINGTPIKVDELCVLRTPDPKERPS